MTAAKTFKIVTLGCRTNQYESQAYADQLLEMGYEPALEEQKADLCIVNTCTVTESADSSSRHKIRALARENPGAEIVVTGCLAERAPEALTQISGVTRVVSNKDKEALLSLLYPEEMVPAFKTKSFEGHTRAFVKVQDGCNSFCTYCIIPYVRGRSRSRRLEEILEEIQGLVDSGFKEVVLTGINIGDFDGATREGEPACRLKDLVKAVDSLPGLERIRISSIDPDEVDEDLLEAVILGKKTCPSMHVVLQSGSNLILKRMNRKYTKEIFLETVERLKKANPDFTFTTDVIVGFPGETERDFLDTLEVISAVKFAKVHMFPYSERKRTKAATYPDKVSPEVISERKQRLLRLAEKVSFDLRHQFIGKVMTVLLENDETTMPGYIGGHTSNFLQVFVPKKEGRVAGSLISVTLIENTPCGLKGLPVNEN